MFVKTMHIAQCQYELYHSSTNLYQKQTSTIPYYLISFEQFFKIGSELFAKMWTKNVNDKDTARPIIVHQLFK